MARIALKFPSVEHVLVSSSPAALLKMLRSYSLNVQMSCSLNPTIRISLSIYVLIRAMLQYMYTYKIIKLPI